MQQYVKKSAVVKAVQYVGGKSPLDIFLDFLAREDFLYTPTSIFSYQNTLFVNLSVLARTKIGWREVNRGDWLVEDADGLLTVYSNERFREKFVTFGDRDMSFLTTPDLVG